MSAQVELGWNNSRLEAGAARASAIVRSTAAGMARSFAGVGASIGGSLLDLLPALAIGESAHQIKEMMNEMDDLADAATKLNTTPEILQRVTNATEIMSSVDVNGFVSSWLKLQKALGDPEGGDALRELGLNARDFAMMPLDKQVLTLSDAWQNGASSGTRYNNLLKVLGKSAGDLIPFLEQGTDAIKEQMAAFSTVPDAAVNLLGSGADKVDEILKNFKSNVTQGVAGLAFLKEIWGRMIEEGITYKESLKVTTDEIAKQQREQKEQLETKRRQIADAQERNRLEAESKAINEELAKIAEKQEAARVAALDPERQILEIDKQINHLRNDLQGKTELDRLKLVEAILDKEKQRADVIQKAQQAAEKKRESGNRAQDIQDELKLLELQGAHRNRAVIALQKEIDLRREALQIAKDLNISEAEATAIATKLQKARDRANDVDPRTGRHKIHGFNGDTPSRGFSGLDGWKKLQDRDTEAFEDNQDPRFPRVDPNRGLHRNRELQERTGPAFDNRGRSTKNLPPPAAANAPAHNTNVESLLNRLIEQGKNQIDAIRALGGGPV